MKPGSEVGEYIEVHSEDEIPEFASEAEEAEFWSTHSLGDEMLRELPPDDPLLPPPRPRATPVSLRVEQDVLTRTKKLARRRHVGYQTLMKQFIAERLYEEEKRDGIIGEGPTG